MPQDIVGWQHFHVTISKSSTYRRGSANQDADILSRLPSRGEENSLESYIAVTEDATTAVCKMMAGNQGYVHSLQLIPDEETDVSCVERVDNRC